MPGSPQQPFHFGGGRVPRRGFRRGRGPDRPRGGAGGDRRGSRLRGGPGGGGPRGWARPGRVPGPREPGRGGRSFPRSCRGRSGRPGLAVLYLRHDRPPQRSDAHPREPRFRHRVVVGRPHPGGRAGRDAARRPAHPRRRVPRPGGDRARCPSGHPRRWPLRPAGRPRCAGPGAGDQYVAGAHPDRHAGRRPRSPGAAAGPAPRGLRRRPLRAGGSAPGPRPVRAGVRAAVRAGRDPHDGDLPLRSRPRRGDRGRPAGAAGVGGGGPAGHRRPRPR